MTWDSRSRRTAHSIVGVESNNLGVRHVLSSNQLSIETGAPAHAPEVDGRVNGCSRYVWRNRGRDRFPQPIADRCRRNGGRCMGRACPQSAGMDTGQAETNQHARCFRVSMTHGDGVPESSTAPASSVPKEADGSLPSRCRDGFSGRIPPSTNLPWFRPIRAPYRIGFGAPEPSPAWPHGMAHGIRPGSRSPHAGGTQHY